MSKKKKIPYTSSHTILLVGEGDFSFALCLAKKFGNARNMVATSRNSRDSLEDMYSGISGKLSELESLGCTVLHGVDVHTMAHHPILQSKDFDRIVFNFPHSGFIDSENDRRQIKRHKKLVRGFFRNAKHILGYKGQIHITHRTFYPYSEWEIEEIAELENLILVKEEDFKFSCYPGYINKKGDGPNCNRTFTVGV
ncbi:PREDICTED: uncharacterized protein At4g26485-like [Lupinus angustifolius]|uniref:uncharacterized protein At4g26485-like n=1 Tax=Lupinus angustifolius TaxID=3871 RepID=UPI00092FB9AD|nr:PREDICTED: uncharacterized protein At4g26485-like [Lupinus angustifolius]